MIITIPQIALDMDSSILDCKRSRLSPVENVVRAKAPSDSNPQLSPTS